VAPVSLRINADRRRASETGLHSKPNNAIQSPQAEAAAAHRLFSYNMRQEKEGPGASKCPWASMKRSGLHILCTTTRAILCTAYSIGSCVGGDPPDFITEKINNGEGASLESVSTLFGSGDCVYELNTLPLNFNAHLRHTFAAHTSSALSKRTQLPLAALSGSGHS
jgi:hypothetical protein